MDKPQSEFEQVRDEFVCSYIAMTGRDGKANVWTIPHAIKETADWTYQYAQNEFKGVKNQRFRFAKKIGHLKDELTEMRSKVEDLEKKLANRHEQMRDCASINTVEALTEVYHLKEKVIGLSKGLNKIEKVECSLGGKRWCCQFRQWAGEALRDFGINEGDDSGK